jgi:hypothetical protein
MYHRLGKSLALLILVACFVLLSVINNPSRVSAATNTLGTTSIGVNVDSGDRNSINAFRFTMPNESGTVNSISVYISSPISASPNNQYQVAIYTDQTGPRTLLASSGSQTITGNAWNTVALTASVTANTTYWLTYNSNAASDSADNLILSPIATCDYAWAAQAYGTWPATAPAMASCSNNTASIYATYTISGSAPDTTPPTVSISAPANNATVSTTTSITANASDAGGVAGVQFKLDGANLGAEDTSSPYSFSWDTTTASNATHSLTATARDTSNNLATSSTITVTVSNTGTPPPPPPPTVFISANPSTITAGSSSTLNWSSTNATSCTASGSWSGTQATSGSQSVLPGATSTYTLTCTGTGGSGNQSTTVTVNAVTPPPPPPPPGTFPWSNIISSSRAANWSTAGAGPIPARTTICQTISAGASAATIQTAINNCASGQTVFLNAGTYNLNTGLSLKSNVTLRGAGANQTKLIMSGSAGCNFSVGTAICIWSGENNYGPNGGVNTATWTGGYSAGSSTVTLSSKTNLAVGHILMLDQTDDANDGYPSAGDLYVCQGCSKQGGNNFGRSGRSQDQVVTVTSIPSTSCPCTIGITPPIIASNWRSSQNPGAWWGTQTISGVGVEDLSVDVSSTGSPPFMLHNATGSWLKGVRSIENSNPGSTFSHVRMMNANFITVRDSYFYGPVNNTTDTYGITAELASSVLVENNIIINNPGPLEHNGPDMGSVWSYNYGSGSWANTVIEHEVGPMLNLYEGNDGSGVTTDIIHGSSSLETFFRNHWHGGVNGITSNTIYWLQSYHREFNIIGDVVGGSSNNTYERSATTQTGSEIFSLGENSSSSTGGGNPVLDSNVKSRLMRWGVYDTVNNAVRFLASEVPSGLTNFPSLPNPSQVLPASFYLSAKPSFFGSMAWPATGPDIVGGNIAGYGGHANKNPARVCFENAANDGAYSTGIKIFNANTCYGAFVNPPPPGPPPPPPSTFSLSVSKNGTGTGTVSGGGISCGGTCSTTVNQGTALTLAAAADPTSTFNGWSGACNGTGACNVTVNSNTSVTATFNTLPISAPTITTQPASITVASGATATFSVVASGNPAPTYQWQKNGVNIAGATSASYTTPVTSSTDDGSTFRAIVTNTAGSVTSANATLTVTAISTKFVIGDRIIAVQLTASRPTPTINDTNLGNHAIGELGTIIGGPTAADGIIWWNINWDTGADGWSGDEVRFDKVTTTFDFTMTNGGNKSVVRGSAVTNTATATLASGTTTAVTFTASGLPTGTSATFAPTSCNPTCTTTVTLTTTASTPVAASTITITGTSGTLVHTTTFTLTVTAPANVLPVGTFDGIAPDGVTLRGWSYDPDSTSSSVSVQLFINGPAGTGTLISSATTSFLRTDINTTFGITGNHGFEVAIPAQYRDGTIHSYYAYGIDFNNSAVSFLLTGSPKSFTVAPPGDTTAPSIPTNLIATATSSTQVNLTWTASTDNVGVTGYKIFRNGTQVNTSTTNSYSDTNLTPSTTYSYTVLANDAAGNNSSQSTASSATTQTGVTPTAGDINLDHIVNSIDFSILNSHWFTTDATSDLNHDGIVNAIDFSILNSNWFKTW